MPKRIVVDSSSNVDSNRFLKRVDGVPGYKNPRAIGYNSGFFEPTDAERKLVFMLVAHGLTIDDITRFIDNKYTGRPITDDTLRKYFWYEIEMARKEVNLRVSQKVLDLALGQPAVFDENGNKTQEELPASEKMLIWWEKTRAGYSDRVIQELGINGEGTKVSLIIEG